MKKSDVSIPEAGYFSFISFSSDSFEPEFKKQMNMKRKILAIVAFLTGVFMLQGCDEKQIGFDRLPSAAQAFIMQYFPDEEVSYAEMDRDDGRRDYSVHLSDGTEIDFDENGNWTNVDCNYSVLPAGLLPAKAMEEISSRHPEAKPYKVEKERMGYEVSLTDGWELVFDASWNYVRESRND